MLKLGRELNFSTNRSAFTSPASSAEHLDHDLPAKPRLACHETRLIHRRRARSMVHSSLTPLGAAREGRSAQTATYDWVLCGASWRSKAARSQPPRFAPPRKCSAEIEQRRVRVRPERTAS